MMTVIWGTIGFWDYNTCRCASQIHSRDDESNSLIHIPAQVFSQLVSRLASSPDYLRQITIGKRERRGLRDAGRFLQLPAELRLKIYRLLLRHDTESSYFICSKSCSLVHRCGSSCVTDGTVARNCLSQNLGLSPAILRSCRLINEEATPILYGENTFPIHCPRRTLDRLHARKMQPDNLVRFQSLYLRQGVERNIFEYLNDDFLPFHNARRLRIKGYWTPQSLCRLISTTFKHLSQVSTIVFDNTADMRPLVFGFDGSLKDQIEDCTSKEDKRALGQMACREMYEQALLEQGLDFAVTRKMMRYRLEVCGGENEEERWTMVATLLDSDRTLRDYEGL